MEQSPAGRRWSCRDGRGAAAFAAGPVPHPGRRPDAAPLSGTPAPVERRLAALIDRTGAAELVATSSTYNRTALACSDAAPAALFGRAQSAGAAAMASPSQP
jgi:hypothetical protein